MRRQFVFALFSLLLTSFSAQAQTVAADFPTLTTVVIQITAHPGKNKNDTLHAMDEIISTVKKQPGFVDDLLLENQSPNGRPTYVHVTRWSSLKQWENVWSQTDFQNKLKNGADYFSVEAGFYKPVKK